MCTSDNGCKLSAQIFFCAFVFSYFFWDCWFPRVHMFNFVRAFGHSWKRRPLNSNCCQGIKGIHCVDEHLLAADLMSDIVWPDCYFQFATTVSKLKQSCGGKKMGPVEINFQLWCKLPVREGFGWLFEGGRTMKHGVLHKPWRETRTRAEPKTYRFDSTVGKRMELLFFFCILWFPQFCSMRLSSGKRAHAWTIST